MSDYRINNDSVRSQINGDNGKIIDQSLNITNNYNIRVNLQERAKSGKVYEYTLFCLHEYKRAKNVPKDIVRVTCINVHSDNMFISDHIHIDFPKRLYNEAAFNYSIMRIKAKAYEYTRTNGTKDLGLIVTKIESAINRIGHYDGKYGTKVLPVLKTDEQLDQREFFKYIYSYDFSHEHLCEILSKHISYLEGLIAVPNQLYSGFLADMILTYYFANDYKQELETKSLYFHNLNREVIIDLIQLLSKLSFKINNGVIFMWMQFMMELNEICNVLQGIDNNICYIKDKKNELNKNIEKFADKIESKETRKIFNKIRIRNEDFEYRYPKDEGKYKEKLHDYVIWYLLSQRDLQLDLYVKTWREDLELI